MRLTTYDQNLDTLYPQIPHSTWYPDNKRRGAYFYESSAIQNVTGRDKNGSLINVPTPYPQFYLTVQQRCDFARLSSPVFIVLSTRMNKISNKDFEIVRMKDEEEEVIEYLKGCYQIYKEREMYNDMKSIVMKVKAVGMISKYIEDILPDMSNFSTALLRWRKSVQHTQLSEAERIKEWLMQPNQGVTWEDFTKKYVADCLIHGACAVYKQKGADGLLDNFDTLASGSVYRAIPQYFTTYNAYVQRTSRGEAIIYHKDEISYSQYLPVGWMGGSMIPLECIIAMVSNQLLADRLMADQADGTRPPEKIVVVTNQMPNLDKTEELPMNTSDQKRIEEKVSRPKKYPVITLTGNDAKILDIGIKDAAGNSLERQVDIRKVTASVFGLSNMEMNLTGSADVSGRETGKEQGEIDRGRGEYPIQANLARAMTYDIIPGKFGTGWKMQYPETKNELEKEQLDALRLQNGKVSKNDLREEDGRAPWEDDRYNQPDDAAGQGDPNGSIVNPLNMRQL